MIGSGAEAVIALTVAVALFLGMMWVSLVSRREGEPVAARRAMGLSLVVPLPFLVVGAIDLVWGVGSSVWILGLAAGAAVVLLVPTGIPQVTLPEPPRGRVDERDLMFPRALLEPGTPRFDDYYERRPERRELDDRFRRRPGMLTDDATLFDPYTFAAVRANFETVEQLRPIIDGPVAPTRVDTDAKRMTRFLKEWLLQLGAMSVGVALMEEYHWYTVGGRGDDYGRSITEADRHTYGIAFTVEMSKEMVDRAPFGPTAMESAQQYLNAGAMGVQVAAFIRGLGHAARGHIDGRYRVICPLVARDAGLGELGRMGLLMTPELGPRVRLGVITTDLPLVADEARPDPTVIDFCDVCKKCADICPPNAIPQGDREDDGGAFRWRIGSEACFTYWCKVGTDCAWCMRVCPYSHPRGLMHDTVRAGIRNNALFRRLAVHLDDLLYGRRPKQVDLVDWMRLREGPPGKN